MKKIYTLSLALALSLPMMADSLTTFKCTEGGIPGQTEPMLMAFSISGDGSYIAGTIQQGGGIFVANTITGEVKYQAVGEKSSELRGVDNNGIGIGFVDDDGALYSFATDDYNLIKAPEGIRYVQGEGISNDGNVKVGSFTQQSFSTEAAYCVGDGGWKALPIPSDEEKGVLKEFMNSMSAAKYTSNDGSVIMGYLGGFTFPMVWTRGADGEYVGDFFPVRFIKTTTADRDDESKPVYSISGMYACMSNNGKYIATIGLIANDNNAQVSVPVVYNTETKTLKVYDQPQKIDDNGFGLYPRGIADDGTFIGTVASPSNPEGNYGGFIMRAGEEQAELFVDAFPKFAEQMYEADLYGLNNPTGISADGKKIVGYLYYSADYDPNTDDPAYYLSYVINLDDTGVDEIGAANSGQQAIFSIDGRQHSRLRKGLNIVRKADGSVTKIMK